MNRTLILPFVVPLLIIHTAATQGSPLPPTPVIIRVTADEPLFAKLKGCVEEELRGLPETIAIVSKEETVALTLDVIAAEERMSDGEMIGYLVYEGGYQPGPQCAVKGLPVGFSRAVSVQWQSLRMFPPDLKAACHRIVIDFKEQVVDPTRAMQGSFGGTRSPRQ